MRKLKNKIKLKNYSDKNSWLKIRKYILKRRPDLSGLVSFKFITSNFKYDKNYIRKSF